MTFMSENTVNSQYFRIFRGIIGMVIAVFATIYGNQVFSTKWLNWLIAAILVGSIIGAIVAKKVQMTGMPQLVAALHSFVGLAAVFFWTHVLRARFHPLRR